MTAETNVERHVGANEDDYDYAKWGVPSIEGTICLTPDDHAGVVGTMALSMAESNVGEKAMAFRGIQTRHGDPGKGETDFVDFSGLYTITDGIVAEISIEGAEREIDDITALLPPGNYKLLGREDPTLIWVGSVLHVYYTVAVVNDEGKFFFSVGHAAGRDINNLKVQPMPFVSTGCKELSFAHDDTGEPVGGLLEQADGGYSTVASFRTRMGADGTYDDLRITLLPQHAKEYFEGSYDYQHIPEPVRWNWIKEHVSPCTIVPSKYMDIDPDNTLGVKTNVVIISARSESTVSPEGKYTHGPFRVGLGLIVSDTESENFGDFLWVSPTPAFIDPNAKNITFASHCEINDEGVTIFAHLDDRVVCEYFFTKADIESRLPQLADVQRFMTQR